MVGTKGRNSTPFLDSHFFQSSIMGSDKSAKKEKKSKRESTGGADDGIPEVKAEYLAPIASPLADEKLSKKVRWSLMEPFRTDGRMDTRERRGTNRRRCFVRSPSQTAMHEWRA